MAKRGPQRGALLPPAEKRVRRGVGSGISGGVEPAEVGVAAGRGERAPARGGQRRLHIQQPRLTGDVVGKPGNAAIGDRAADLPGSTAGGREVVLVGVTVIGAGMNGAIVLLFPIRFAVEILRELVRI